MLKDLAKVALLGTDRADLTPAQKEMLATQGIDIEADNTQVLLEAVALYAQQEKAGFLLQKITEELPSPADDAEEYACSDTSAQHLQQILNGKFRPALSEFIEYLSRTPYRAPADMLPDIIENQLAAGATFSDFSNIIGRRGAWLMRQNPKWHRHLPLEDTELWATGNQAERLAVLRFLRGKYPELAVEILQQSWQKETNKNKISFLEILAEGISADDEAFLEICLDEKNAEIRAIAATLLARVPASGFVKRLSERLEQHVFWKNGRLEVKMPDEPDTDGIRDNLFGELKNARQGMRTAWLARMVAFLPPHLWEKKSAKTSGDILPDFWESDYGQVIFGSVLAAAQMHENSAWAAAFLTFATENHQTFALPAEDTERLTALLSATEYNDFLAFFLEKYPVTKPNSPLTNIIKVGTRRLNALNTETVVNQYRRLISEGNNLYGNQLPQKKLLQIVAYQADFDIYDRLKTGWDMNAPLWRAWADEIEQFMRILQFRRVMREGLGA